jgi:peptidoglycan hydrolase-like protein with peptidoglycan-binding domain
MNLLALLPLLLGALNNPVVQAMMPLVKQLLDQLGKTQFPQVEPNKATDAALSLFDANSIKWVQTALILHGATLDPDGICGETTKAAVTAIQKELGLTADGWPGHITQDALRAMLLKKAGK